MTPIAENDLVPADRATGQGNAPDSKPSSLSAAARDRMLAVRGEPLLYADWSRAVFIHFEVDPDALQHEIPFPLDLHDGRAYLSLVAFNMRDMRPRLGGRLGALLFKPIATHGFLNVRAYVRHRGEPGIHFLAEWLSNPLSVRLGPPLFGLPYRLGQLQYDHRHETGLLRGTVTDSKNSARLEYSAELAPAASFHPRDANTLDEFLLERYTAFTMKPLSFPVQSSGFKVRGSRFPSSSPRRFFRIWHPPWPQIPLEISLLDTNLLTQTWPWLADARLIGANYSPGVRKVWMGRPQRA
jgi:uncharacterized protein